MNSYSEQILKNNLERLQKFSNIMISAASLKGRYLTVPPAFCNLVGYTKQELLTMTFKDITHPDDYDNDWEQCQRLLDNEIASFDLNKRYITKTGDIKWVYIDCSLFKDDTGKPLHFLTFIKDITAQKQQELELKLNYDLIHHYIRYMDRLTNDFRKMRHKYLNIIQGISGYLDLDNLEGAKCFLNNMLHDMEEFPIHNAFRLHLVKDIPFRGMIASKISQAELQNIDVALIIEDEITLCDMGLHLMKLCKIVESHLDHAIDKARGSVTKKINIIISEDALKIKIIIQNTINPVDCDQNDPVIKRKSKVSTRLESDHLLRSCPNISLNTNYLKNILIQELVIKKAEVTESKTPVNRT